MNSHDDMQKVWQQDNSTKENRGMWMQLIREKRMSFDELVRAGNQTEYLVALLLGPVLGLMAWKAKYPWVQVGYGLLGATMIVLAMATWIMQRQRPMQNDHSLRDHLEALLDSYDRRIRFLRSGKFWVSLPLSAGAIAVIMGIPGNVISTGAWGLVCILLTAFTGGQWLSYTRARTRILEKRQEAVQLLRELPGD